MTSGGDGDGESGRADPAAGSCASGAPAPDQPVVLPPAVRDRVVALAADRLGALPPEQVPATLRAFARFTPGKRARLAAVPLAAALEVDPAFREAVADGVRTGLPGLAAALDAGRPVPAAPPADVAAAAYLLRPAGWQAHVATAVTELRTAGSRTAGSPTAGSGTAEDGAAGTAGTAELARLGEQLAAVRARADAEVAQLHRELEQARREAARVRRQPREMGDRAGRAEAAQRTAEAAAEQVRADAETVRQRAAEQVAAAQERQQDAERAVVAGRQAAREGRQADELRLRLLLDVLLGAAGGLRRELALPPLSGRPADAVAGQYASARWAAPSPQGRDDDDPALLDALLAVPMVHLLVDGYNVTKSGYGELSLEAQRHRLLAGLGAPAARTAAEVTVVFDGAEQVGVAAPAPRGVRLLFSREGETADEVLRRLVRLEPKGRPLVVVSTDREVAEGVRAAGARPVRSLALLRLLGRA